MGITEQNKGISRAHISVISKSVVTAFGTQIATSAGQRKELFLPTVCMEKCNPKH